MDGKYHILEICLHRCPTQRHASVQINIFPQQGEHCRSTHPGHHREPQERFPKVRRGEVLVRRHTAVLVNEFGEVGLDHHLIEHASESTLLLENGCLCCAVRGDLQASLRDLLDRRERGEIPRFERVVIETSGLADPVPIAYTVLADPLVQHHYRLGNILTVVDAVNTLPGSR